MLRSVLLAASLLAASPGLAQSPADEAAVRAAEARQRDAVMAGDLPTLERIWSPTFVVNNPQNRVTADRAGVLDGVRSGRISYTAYAIEIDRITFNGDLAIVMGGETVTPRQGPDAGKVVRRRYTDVWRRAEDGWIAVARQATILHPPPAP